MFGMVYIVATAAIAWRKRSKAALVAVPALMATGGLFWAGVADAGAYSSAIWAGAGLWLIIQGLGAGDTPRNSDLVAGFLYGISGSVYVLLYIGFEDAALSFVHIVSDLAFCLGLVAGTWPNARAYFRSWRRRVFRRSGLQATPQNMARNYVHDWF